MNQAILDFDLQAQASDRAGFELGWDHARHGLVPPPGLLLDGTPIGQGWRAGKAVFGRRTLAATRLVRRWLALRTTAWRQGEALDPARLTLRHLAALETAHCAVTRRALGGAAGGDDAPVVARLNAAAGYTPSRLAMLCTQAAAALEGLDAGALLRRAVQADAGLADAPGGLTPAQGWRLAVLASFATTMPFTEAVRVPLRVLPPPGAEVVNPVQQLQALVTLQFVSPGWSERIRRLAALLPAAGGDALRHDLQLLAGALAARLLEARAGTEPLAVRRALEDAWADRRVNQRWQAFAHALGEAGVHTLLGRALQAPAAAARSAAPASPADGAVRPVLPRVAMAPARALRLVAAPRRAAGGGAARA